MRVFVSIVEAGRMTAAADTLGLSGPAVVRSLAGLERDLGVRLIHRTTRRLSLSDEGREYFARCKRVLEDVQDAETSLTARHLSPRGRLRLTAPTAFGRKHLAPVVFQFRRRYPEVEVELLLVDRVVDLVEEGLDLALRIGELSDSTLVAKPVGRTQRVVCATPAYWKQAGFPRVPADLAGQCAVLFTGLGAGTEWTFAGPSTRRVKIRPVLRTNHVETAIDACVTGLGCGRFLSYQVAELVEAGKLRTALRGFEPPSVPVHLVYPGSRLLSANVRAFLDFAVDRLRSEVHWPA